MLINKKNIKKLRVAHTESSRTRVKSLSFLYTGEKLIFNTDEKISILSLGERVTVHVIKPKNGAGLCRFFDVATVLHSSITIHEVKLLHVEHHHYIRIFPGHEKKITSIATTEKKFATSSEDGSVRLWDPRTSLCETFIKFPAATFIAFHPSGEVFAVAHSSSTIEIFSTRNLEKPTSKVKYERVADVEWTGIKFSDDGQLLMVTTNSSSILIFDTATTDELHNFKGKL